MARRTSSVAATLYDSGPVDAHYDNHFLAEYKLLADLLSDRKITFYCAGREICPDTGRRHLQTYIESRTPRTLAAWIALLAPHHVELCIGTQEQNLVYCRKGNDFLNFGIPKAQGKRNDLHDVKMLIDEGRGELEVWENHFNTSIKFHKSFAVYRELKQAERRTIPNVSVFWGEPGTGKSTAAFANPGATAVSYTVSGFLIGYRSGQLSVIFDDFDWRTVPRNVFLQFTHGHPFTVNVKGGEVKFVATTIIFTSNDPPTSWYSFNGDSDQAVMRRLTTIRQFHPIIELE